MPSHRDLPELDRRLKICARRLSHDPSDPLLLQEMAEILVRLGRLEQGTSRYQDLARSLLGERQSETVVEICHRVLELEPGNSAALALLAEVESREFWSMFETVAPSRRTPDRRSPLAATNDPTLREDPGPAALEQAPADLAGNWSDHDEEGEDEETTQIQVKGRSRGSQKYELQPTAEYPLDLDPARILHEPDTTVDLRRPASLRPLWDQPTQLENDEPSPPAVQEPPGVQRPAPACRRAPTMVSLAASPAATLPFPAGLLQAGRLRIVPAGECIYEEGQQTDDLCHVLSGRVVLIKRIRRGILRRPDEEQLAILQAGSFFGEMSLLGDGYRHVSARALETCELRLLRREAVLEGMRASPPARRALWRLLNSRLLQMVQRTFWPLQDLDPGTQESFLALGRPLVLRPGSAVMAKGVMEPSFYVVLLGTLEVTCGSQLLQYLGDGDFFGGIPLLLGQPAPAAVSTRSLVHLLHIPGAGLIDLLEQEPGLARVLVSECRRRLTAYESILRGEAHYDLGTTVFVLEHKKE